MALKMTVPGLVKRIRTGAGDGGAWRYHVVGVLDPRNPGMPADTQQ